MDDLKSKFFLRSRKIQAALILGLSALTALGASTGVDLPTWLTTDWLTGLLNSITGDSGLGASLLDAYAAAQLVWSMLRPDDAKLKAIPGTGDLKLAAPLRAALTVLIAVGGIGLAFDARAVTAYAKPTAVTGRWTWSPAENATAYNVRVSRNGGAYALERAVTAPEVMLPAALGETLVLVVEPLAPGVPNVAPGALSDASESVRFLGSPDLDGDGPVQPRDVTRAASEAGRCIRPASSGSAVPATPC